MTRFFLPFSFPFDSVRMAQNAFDAGLHYSGRAVGDAQGVYAALSEKAIDSCVPSLLRSGHPST